MRQLKIAKQITKRESESFSRYLQEISAIAINPISPDEEAELALRIKDGDEDAKKKLVTCNLRFVVSVAKQYQNSTTQLSDLVNEGNIGLIIAAEKYDATRGIKFISYAVWWIRQSILKYLSENLREIRLPINKINQLNKIKKIQEEFERTFERKPTLDEISERLALGMENEDMANLIVMDRGAQSININIPNDNKEGFTIEDSLIDPTQDTPDQDMHKQDLKKCLKLVLTKLHPREREVIIHSFGLEGHSPKTLEEIAVIMDLTRERIRQIKQRAILVLYHRFGKAGEVLMQYL